MENRRDILQEKISLGIELGSTRIKSVLLNERNQVLATGTYDWENKWENGFWTYDLKTVLLGVQSCYLELKKNIKKSYGVTLTKIGSIGISAMMHGYLVFDKSDNLLVPFRTWRNTNTTEAAEKLTELFQYNIPERWSISHLYQAILKKENHIKDISFMTTLAGYVHYELTGEKVLGIGDASGMFPIDTQKKTYDPTFVNVFQEKILNKESLKLEKILPKVLLAGEIAGTLTSKGARILDPEGDLVENIPFCPPEGDAGTGMMATNSVKVKSGNISAGTSVFAMVVLEKKLQKLHREVDLVTTPAGDLVGMIHANNCSSEINAWMSLFKEVVESLGFRVDNDTLYETLLTEALNGKGNGGNLLAYAFQSGESIVQVEKGRPLFVRKEESEFTLPNFIKAQFYAAFATLKIGMDILLEEKVSLEKIYAHGGLFKTKDVSQQLLASILNLPVTVMTTASEGGAYGMGLLAHYLNYSDRFSLSDYLEQVVFVSEEEKTICPDEKDVLGFSEYLDNFKKGLVIEKSATKNF